MKRGISINRDYDYQGIPCVVIKKKRGKLTLRIMETGSAGSAAMSSSSTVRR